MPNNTPFVTARQKSFFVCQFFLLSLRFIYFRSSRGCLPITLLRFCILLWVSIKKRWLLQEPIASRNCLIWILWWYASDRAGCTLCLHVNNIFDFLKNCKDQALAMRCGVACHSIASGLSKQTEGKNRYALSSPPTYNFLPSPPFCYRWDLTIGSKYSIQFLNYLMDNNNLFRTSFLSSTWRDGNFLYSNELKATRFLQWSHIRHLKPLSFTEGHFSCDKRPVHNSLNSVHFNGW